MLSSGRPACQPGSLRYVAELRRFMRRSRLAHLFLLATVGLAGFSQLASSQAAPTSPAFRTFIHGSVRDAVTHRAMEKIVVMVEGADSGYADQAQTDSSGNFMIQGLPASVYVVRVRVPGYEEMTQRVDLTVVTSNYLSFELRPKPGSEAPPVPAEGSGARLDAHLAVRGARKEFETGQKLVNEKKDLDGGIKHFRKAIQLYDKYAEAYLMLGLAYQEQQKFEDAQTALQKSTELDPNAPGAFFALGTLFNQEKKYPEAEKALSRGLELKPDVAAGQYEIARTYWVTGRWQDAEPHAKKAVEVEPAFAPAHIVLGNVALRKNDPTAALKEFKEYLRLDPNGPYAAGVTQMVQKLQPAPKQ